VPAPSANILGSPKPRRLRRPSLPPPGGFCGRPKPKVYFEEWDDPLISGIGWVSELIEIAGGEEVFPELRKQKAAKDRIISPDDVIAAARRRHSRLLVRQKGRSGQNPATTRLGYDPGWNDRIVEIKSPLILQPGPGRAGGGGRH
jgi:iron complex transport system substrate-binding protein